MKKSGQVVLTAVFLTAVSAAGAKAQEAPVADTTKVKDSTIADSNATVNYDSPDGYVQDAYTQPPVVYNGFFTFHWLPWRRRYYYPHHHHHHHNGHETSHPRATAGTAPHNGFRTAAPQPAAVNTHSANGFGGTMHGSNHVAHS